MAFRLLFARFAALACCLVALTPSDAFAVAWNRMATVDNATATNTALCTWSSTGAGILECASANPYIVGGFLGIGSSSPVNALDIGTSQGIRIASGTPTNTNYALYNNAGTLTWNGTALASLSGGVAGYDAIWTLPTTIGTGLIYESSGKVGIGTTSPQSTLSVSGGGLAVGSYAATTTVGVGSAIFSGNVGIGTAAPNAPLHVLLGMTNGNYGNIVNIGPGMSQTIGTNAGNNSAVFVAPYLSLLNTQDWNSSLAINGVRSSPSIQLGATGTINTINSFLAQFTHSGTNTVTNYQGLRVGNPGGGGPITNATGITLDAMSAATNNTYLLIGQLGIPSGNYGIYNASTNNNYFAGAVGIGTTSPGSTLQVNGGAAVGYSANTAAPSNGLAVSGSVGIGTTAPATGMAADVNGPVKVAGTGSEPCTAAQVGGIRYNKAGQYFEVCNYP